MPLQNDFFNAKSLKLFVKVVLIISFFFSAGCSKEDPVQPDNNAPTIGSITALPNRVGYSDNVTLTVNASDEDNDDLTYRWTSDYGAYTGAINTTNATWQAPNQVLTSKCEVTVSDGVDSVTSSVNIEVMGLFFDEFSTDLAVWENSFCNSWISSGEAHLEGDVSGYYGTLSHLFSSTVSPEYTVKMQLATVDNFPSDEFYGLYTRVDDTGAITIASWWFIIEPSAVGENWALICFISSSAGSEWVLLDQDSFGESSLINTGDGVWNDISWTIESDKTVIVKAGNQILYQSDEISDIENTFGITITMDLVSAGCRTHYQREVKIDDALITILSQPTSPLTGGKNIEDKIDQTLLEDVNDLNMPDDLSKLMTLREALNLWY